MRAFHLLVSLAILALAVRCGTAEKDVSRKTSAAVPSVKSAAPAETVKPADAPAPAVNPLQTQDTQIIIARCIEIPGTFPPNDLYNYLYLMKYRVLKVIKGSFKDKEVLVAHYNPRIPRPQIKDRMAPFVAGNVVKFETGDKHRLVLISPISIVIEERVEDEVEYADSDLDKYYALRADVAR
jgi:hypothetical protein